MAKRKPKTEVITDKKALNALVLVMRDRILEWEQEIVAKRKSVIRSENLINDIKITGKYVQTF